MLFSYIFICRDPSISVDSTVEDKRMVIERLKVKRKEDLSVEATETTEMEEELLERLKNPSLLKLRLKLLLKLLLKLRLMPLLKQSPRDSLVVDTTEITGLLRPKLLLLKLNRSLLRLFLNRSLLRLLKLPYKHMYTSIVMFRIV